jgi:hypothetical protein
MLELGVEARCKCCFEVGSPFELNQSSYGGVKQGKDSKPHRNRALSLSCVRWAALVVC